MVATGMAHGSLNQEQELKRFFTWLMYSRSLFSCKYSIKWMQDCLLAISTSLKECAETICLLLCPFSHSPFKCLWLRLEEELPRPILLRCGWMVFACCLDLVSYSGVYSSSSCLSSSSNAWTSTRSHRLKRSNQRVSLAESRLVHHTSTRTS